MAQTRTSTGAIDAESVAMVVTLFCGTPRPHGIQHWHHAGFLGAVAIGELR
jgi:hypothetical protein